MTPEHRRVLAHESGHALVSWFSPSCDHVIEVIARENGNGIVMSAWPNLDAVPIHWDRTAQALGGLAGEFCEIGKFRANGAQDDLLVAIGATRALLKKDASGSAPWKRDELAERTFHLERAFTNGLTVAEAKVMDTSLRHAIHLIERHRAGFDLLRKRLMTQRLVYGRELEEYFGDRTMIRLLGRFR